MRYTVKQLARASGATVRALHYYDQIGLLRPAQVGENGYRYYEQDSLLRLQQILFYRELDFSLEQIKEILHRPDFDLLDALKTHRAGLLRRMDRLSALIDTVDHTMQYLQGEREMTTQDFYSGFDEQRQEQLAEEAALRWGPTARQSQQRWQGYSREKKNALLGEMSAISTNVAGLMDESPASPAVQQWIDRWFRLINENFYDCSLEIFAQLGHSYTADPAFEATYEAVKPGLAAFMEQAVTHYCATR